MERSEKISNMEPKDHHKGVLCPMRTAAGSETKKLM